MSASKYSFSVFVQVSVLLFFLLFFSFNEFLRTIFEARLLVLEELYLTTKQSSVFRGGTTVRSLA